jgi:hypothetical protein
MCRKMIYLFPMILLIGGMNDACALSIRPIEAVATFNNIGIEVDFTGAPPPGTIINVAIKSPSDSSYREVHPLSWIINDNSRGVWKFAGSIFYLDPGTAYDIKLSSLAFDQDQYITVTTRQHVNISDGRGRVYYVSPNGNDSNPCSHDLPCTLRYVLPKLTPGDTMALFGGTYYEGEISIPSSGSESDPIVIRAVEGQIPILDGTDIGFIPNWKPTEVSVVYKTPLPSYVTPGAIYNVYLDGENLFRYKNLSDLKNNKWGYGCHISNTDGCLYVRFPNDESPVGHQVTIPKYDRAIHIESDHIYIKGIQFQHYDGHHCDACGESTFNAAIEIDGASYNIIRECFFYHNGVGIMLRGEASFNEVANCYFNESPKSKWFWEGVKNEAGGTPGYESGGILMKESMIQLAPSKGNVFHGNRFEDMFDGCKLFAVKLHPGLPDVCDLSAMRKIATTNLDFYENEISNCLDDGLETDGAGINNRIYHNVIKNCLIGISLAPAAIGPTYVFRNEISGYIKRTPYRGSSFKFNVGGDLKTQYVYLYHNTCYTDTPDLDGLKFWGIKGRETSCNNDGSNSWDKVFFRNNILGGTKHALSSEDSCQSYVDMDYDSFYATAANNIFQWGGVNYQTLRDFANATREELHGIYGDPGFADAEGGDFYLAPGSINVDRGVEIPGINDLNYRGDPGSPRPGAPDIGAYELGTDYPKWATDPLPPNKGRIDEGVEVCLSWHAPEGAVSHDIYFGVEGDLGFMGNQLETTYCLEGLGLLTEGTYTWRIDEHMSNGQKIAGKTWRFTVLGPVSHLSIVGLNDGNTYGYMKVGTAWMDERAWKLPDVGYYANPTFADLDGDGDLDAIVGDSTGIGKTYENDGSAEVPVWVRKTAWDLPDVGSNAAPTLGDLDCDGDSDALIGNSVGQVLAYKNIGTRSSPIWMRYSAWDLPVDVGSYADPMLVDLDGDGDMDLLVGEYRAGVLAFRNDGSCAGPVWVRNPAWDAPSAGVRTTVAAGDLDNDGDVDLILGNYLGQVLGYENTGTSGAPVWTRKPAWDSEDLGSYSAPAFF